MTIASEDWPGFWAGLLDTPAGSVAVTALSRQMGAIEREVRLATGIRPTPLRWSVWLGDRALLSVRDGHGLLCVRPGLLMRAAEFAGLAPLPAAGHAVAHAWNDGYLLYFFGPREGEVPRAGAALDPEAGGDAPAVQIQFPGEGEGFHLRWEAAPGWPVEITGTGPLPAAARTTAPIPDAAPGALLDLLVDAPGRGIETSLLRAMAHAAGIEPAAVTLEPQVPGELSQNIADTHAPLIHKVLFDLQFDGGRPIVHAGHGHCLEGQAWGRHPFAQDALYPPLTRVPYAWDGVEGFLLPLRGHDYTYGCAIQGPWSHTANPPENLAALLLDAGAAPGPAPLFRATLDWRRAADVLGAWFRSKGTGQDPFASEREAGAWVAAVRALGMLHLEAREPAQEDPLRWRLSGRLAEAMP